MKYRVAANLVWDIEEISGDKNKAESKAMEQLLAMARSAGVRLRKPKLSINRLKELDHTKILGEFEPEEVFKHLSSEGHRKEFHVDGSHGGSIYKVRLNSSRYFTFRENRTCVSCGLIGSKMLLELPRDSAYPHFNLYAYDDKGNRVLMTKDHKIPVALGGKDITENYQTMCAICNNIKAHDLIHLDDLSQIRKIYNEAIENHTCSTELHSLIQSKKAELIQKRLENESTEHDRLFQPPKVITPTSFPVSNPMPVSLSNDCRKAGLIFAILSATVITALFDPFYAGVGLAMAILGYTAGKIR